MKPARKRQLNGKHVLVTGGSRGIGLACVRAFLAEGARVSLVGRSRANLDAAIAALKAEGHGAILSMDGAATPMVV